MEPYIVLIFILGYLLIALEHPIKINKTATALVTGTLCWTLFALDVPDSSFLNGDHYSSFVKSLGKQDGLRSIEIYNSFIEAQLAHHLGQIASILFFLMGAMIIVELVDSHHGFRFITDRIKTKDVRKLLWIISWTTFFLSAILDNLTTAIVMISLARKLVHEKEQRLFFAGMIIIAANAGGAWTPIGDVTTTMLWIGGQISSLAIIMKLLAPSMVCLLVPLVYLSFKLKGSLKEAQHLHEKKDELYVKGGKTMLFVGLGSLICVPVFKTITHLPPYLGMLLGLGKVGLVSKLINPVLDDLDKKKNSR